MNKRGPGPRQRSDEHLEFIKETGSRIRKARIEAGISQKDFAEMIECSTALLNRFENGKIFPGNCLNLWSFRKACKILKKDANYLLGRQRKKSE